MLSPGDKNLNFQFTSDESLITKAIDEASQHRESLILGQLNDFVSRGLIIVESGPMSMVRDQFGPNPNELQIRQTVTLRLKDREYIESLEKKVNDQATLLRRLAEFNR